MIPPNYAVVIRNVSCVERACKDRGVLNQADEIGRNIWRGVISSIRPTGKVAALYRPVAVYIVGPIVSFSWMLGRGLPVGELCVRNSRIARSDR